MTAVHKMRATVIFFIFSIVYCIIVGNLYYIQIVQSSFYTNLGRTQYAVTVRTLPPRGLIVDCKGHVLAVNRDSYAAFILPNALVDSEKLLTFLQKHFPSAVQRLAQKKRTSFMYVKRKLSEQQIALIKASGCEDIKLLKEPHRYYPFACAAPVIGITDIDNHGLFGIEQICNAQLAGSETTMMLEKDARLGHFYFKKEITSGIVPQNVALTIDADVQFIVYEEVQATLEQFNAQSGGAIIIDPMTGALCACVSCPSIDPNSTKQLNLDHARHKIVTDSYELGSVVKVFVALAAFQEGLVTPDELIDCKNSKLAIINGTKLSTVLAQGIVPFSTVIQKSNNIGMAQIALRLQDRLYDHLVKVGFGKKTGLSWPGEQQGFVNPPHNWSRPSVISLSLGYEITATLLQLTRAFCLFANGGHLVTPYIFADQKPAPFGEQLYSDAVLAAMRTILQETVNSGTASYAKKLKGYRVMGKTGTANMVINGVYNTQHNRYTFCGIIEKDSYKRVIVTFVEDARCNQPNLYASTIAVPLFERIAEQLLLHDKILKK